MHQAQELGKESLVRLLMALDRLCYYGRSDCTNKKLIVLHELYRQGLPDSLVRLICSVAVYAIPSLATFQNQLTATHLVMFIAILD